MSQGLRANVEGAWGKDSIPAQVAWTYGGGFRSKDLRGYSFGRMVQEGVWIREF